MGEATRKKEKRSDRSDQPGDANNEEKMPCMQKLMLCALLLGNEVSVNLQQLFTLPILQTLELPLDLAFVSMLVGGLVGGLVVPTVGWLSDRGSNPNCRKGGAAVLSACFLFAGLSCVATASIIHLSSLKDGATAHIDGDMLLMYKVPLGISEGLNSSPSRKRYLVNSSARQITNFSSETVRGISFEKRFLDGKSEPRSHKGNEPLIRGHTSPERHPPPAPELEKNVLRRQLAQEMTSSRSAFSQRQARQTQHTPPVPGAPNTSRNSSVLTKPSPQTRANSSQTLPDYGGGSGHPAVSFKAGLGMFGFILLDIGFESTLASSRSWVVTCSPRSEHTSVLETAVVMASLGGIIGSTLANAKIDLPIFGPGNVQGRALPFQTICQCCLAMLLVIFGLSVSLALGFRRLRNNHNVNNNISVNHNKNSNVQKLKTALKEWCSCFQTKKAEIDSEKQKIIDSELCHLPLKSRGDTDGSLNTDLGLKTTYQSLDETNRMTTNRIETVTNCYPEESSYIMSDVVEKDSCQTKAMTNCSSEKSISNGDEKETEGIINCSPSKSSYFTPNSVDKDNLELRNGESNASTNKPADKNDEKAPGFTWPFRPNLCKTEQSLKVKIILICVISYLSTAVGYLNTMTVSDFMGKAVYGGQPAGQGDSASTQRYQAGVTMTASGFIVYYVVYLVFSSQHSRVLYFLGYKVEFALMYLLMSGSLLLLILTARLEAFFALFVVAGAHRTCCNVIPSAVMNDVIQAEAEKSGAGRSAPVGLAMSLVSLMNLVAYFTVFPVLGPLERLTGHSSVSLWIAAGCGCLATVVFHCIDLPKRC